MKYRLLGRSGLRVSELCLGTMTFGEDWGMGSSFEESKTVFDGFLNAGGNFIDTANMYTNGSSERFLSEMISSERDNLVLATKYTLSMAPNKVNLSGNHRKNLVQSVEKSLSRLKTDYIDLLWLHAWDYTTPVEEVMRSLDDLVRSGKVLYLGVSNTPAWIVSQANEFAKHQGLTPFVGNQVEYSLVERTAERDVLPMSRELGLGVLAWSPLGGGTLTGKYLKASEGARFSDTDDYFARKAKSDRNLTIATKLMEIAKAENISPASLALAWIRQSSDNVIPILGARKLSQLEDNLQCTEIQLSPKTMESLDHISRIELGYPHDFLGQPQIMESAFGGTHSLLEGIRKPRI